MDILYLTEHNPLGVGCGAVTRTYAIWRALQSLGAVTTVVLDGKHPRTTDRDVENGVLHRILPDLYCGWKRRNLFRIFALLTGRVDFAYGSREEVLSALGLEGRKFDAVVVRYFWNLERTAAWKIAPCHLDFDDHPFDYFTATEWKVLSGFGLLKEKFRVWLRMRLMCRVCRDVWLSNRDHCGRLRCKGRKARFVPNIAKGPADGYVIPRQHGRYLLSVGAMGYAPNVKGLEWFLDTVWPEVRRLYPDLVFKVVGKDCEPELKAKLSLHAGVDVLGFVEDLMPVYANAIGLVAPLFAGGGTCIKVIESQLYGVKVFGTPIALRGFDQREVAESKSTIFCTKDEFLTGLGGWLALGDDELHAARTAIRTFALSRNSQRNLDSIVRESLVK